jgi:hypothetical protein
MLDGEPRPLEHAHEGVRVVDRLPQRGPPAGLEHPVELARRFGFVPFVSQGRERDSHIHKCVGQRQYVTLADLIPGTRIPARALELLQPIDGRIDRDHVTFPDAIEGAGREQARTGAQVEHDVALADIRVLEDPIALLAQWTKPVK